MEGIELWTQFIFGLWDEPGTPQCVFEGDWREETEKERSKTKGSEKELYMSVFPSNPASDCLFYFSLCDTFH